METTGMSAADEESLSKGITNATPLSRYLALALMIALPFIGGVVGYSVAREQVVEMVDPQSTEQSGLNDDFAHYLKYKIPVSYKGLSRRGDFFAYIPLNDAVLKIVELKNNKVLHELSSASLTFLDDGDDYKRSFAEMLPDDTGNAVFIDLADACECNLENEAIIVTSEDGVKIFPLPNAEDFEWLAGKDQWSPGEELKYRYKLAVYDKSLCEGEQDGICVAVRVVDEWIYGQVDLESADALREWDGEPFNTDL